MGSLGRTTRLYIRAMVQTPDEGIVLGYSRVLIKGLLGCISRVLTVAYTEL